MRECARARVLVSLRALVDQRYMKVPALPFDLILRDVERDTRRPAYLERPHGLCSQRTHSCLGYSGSQGSLGYSGYS